ncbi:MAG: hypothetical protein KDA57_22850, partial [Planctomycetales bacterium]|nr:hypothetical protein [Planctomycetales bacterium]
MISANCRNLIFKTALLLAFCTAPYVQAQVTVTTSDGTSFTGALAEWNAKGLTLSLPSGEQTQLAADQLLSVQPQFATELDEPDTGRLELVDGTILPFTTYTVSDRQATVGTTLSDQPLSIPTSSIQRLQFAPLEEKVSQLWNDLADKQLTGDVLIVYKNKGASLDYLTGVLGDVSDEQLTFRWDNDEIPVKRSKVAAFSYFHSRQQEIPEPLCWAKLRTDARLPISSITYSQEELQLATSGGLKFQIPFAALDEVDYSFGKVVYLSDLQPV